ncbi:hypothetical protein ACIRPH_31555 [Nocardiopsis sp. NPDC101807]|uniref:hypothetical protein n=1 Tax=Nocardiopsis sp. NPDC101807 TaxID=3364339 RepID=UPI0038293D91
MDPLPGEPPTVVTASRRILMRTCEWCGTEITTQKHGRGGKRKYCSPAHRQRAYEVRTALRRQERDREAGTARRADEPVRELVQETVTRTRLVPGRDNYASPDPWQEPDLTPLPTTSLPRPREIQRLLTQTAAAIAQGHLTPSEIDRVMRGVEQVRTARSRFYDGLSEHRDRRH